MNTTQLFLLFMTVVTAITVLFTHNYGELMFPISAYEHDRLTSPEYENVPVFVPTFAIEESVAE